MKQVYLERYDEGEYKIYRIPCIAVTAKGTVLTAYECRHSTNDWAAIDIGLRRSTDGGQTWSERTIVADGHECSCLHNPVLFIDGDTVHLLYNMNYHEAYYTRSTDDGLTWAEPRCITSAYETMRPALRYTVIANGPCHGLVTSKGRLIVPVWVVANKYDIKAHGPSVVTTLYSDDHGDTWQCGEIVTDDPGYRSPSESVLAELKDGSILINCRHTTDNGMRLLATSPDGISGWHDLHFAKDLTEPICAAGMTSDGRRLWFTHCDDGQNYRRIDLSLLRADDQGQTWRKLYTLDPFGGYSDTFYDATSDKLYVFAETDRAIPGDDFSFGLSAFILDGNEI